MYCLESDKICPVNNLRCKECVLLDCKRTLAFIEEVEKMEQKKNEKALDREIKLFYPECYNCPFLERLGKAKVRCSYMINKRCVLNEGCYQ